MKFSKPTRLELSKDTRNELRRRKSFYHQLKRQDDSLSISSPAPEVQLQEDTRIPFRTHPATALDRAENPTVHENYRRMEQIHANPSNMASVTADFEKRNQRNNSARKIERSGTVNARGAGVKGKESRSSLGSKESRSSLSSKSSRASLASSATSSSLRYLYSPVRKI